MRARSELTLRGTLPVQLGRGVTWCDRPVLLAAEAEEPYLVHLSRTCPLQKKCMLYPEMHGSGNFCPCWKWKMYNQNLWNQVWRNICLSNRSFWNNLLLLWTADTQLLLAQMENPTVIYSLLIWSDYLIDCFTHTLVYTTALKPRINLIRTQAYIFTK